MMVIIMKYKELITYNNNYDIVGIFNTINNIASNQITFIKNDNIIQLDNSYYFHSGMKTLNKSIISFIDNIVNINDEEKKTIILEKFSKIIINTYQIKWNRLYEVISKQYELLNNYTITENMSLDTNFTEEQNSSSSSKQSTNSNITTTDTNEDMEETYGFNNDQSVPTDESNRSSTSTTQGNKEDNYTDNEETKEVEKNRDINVTKELTRTGKDGKTFYQDILLKEIELREYNFFENVFNDIDKILCLKIYEF